MQTLRLCVFLAFIVALRAYGLSVELAEFYCAVNGDYTDSDQVKKDGASRTQVDVRIIPVVAPELSPLPVVYVEEATAGVLARALILIVTQGDDGIIYTEPKNFTGNTDIKPGQFDVNRIKSLTKEDLQGQENCRDVFERVDKFVFSINYPDCQLSPVNGQRESYGVTDTCENFYVVPPPGAPEKPTLVPYLFKLQGKKYPLEDAPANYDCNCGKPSV